MGTAAAACGLWAVWAKGLFVGSVCLGLLIQHPVRTRSGPSVRAFTGDPSLGDEYVPRGTSRGQLGIGYGAGSWQGRPGSHSHLPRNCCERLAPWFSTTNFSRSIWSVFRGCVSSVLADLVASLTIHPAERLERVNGLGSGTAPLPQRSIALSRMSVEPFRVCGTRLPGCEVRCFC